MRSESPARGFGITCRRKLRVRQTRLRAARNQAREQAEGGEGAWRWKGGPHGVRQLAKAGALGYCLRRMLAMVGSRPALALAAALISLACGGPPPRTAKDRKSTRLN